MSEPNDFDLLTFVMNMFLLDLGEDHLENFQLSDGDLISHIDFHYTAIPLAPPVDLFQFEIIEDGYKILFYPNHEVPIKNRYTYSRASLRAPPHTT